MLLSGKGPMANRGELTLYRKSALRATPSMVALKVLGLVKLAKNVAHCRSPASVVSPRLSPAIVEHSAFTSGKKSALLDGIVQVLSACPSVMPGATGVVLKVPPRNHTGPDWPALQST